MKCRNSLIDKKWMVITIDQDDSQYEDFKHLFDEFGLGIGDLKNLTMYIDGKQSGEQNLTDDHIQAIEAHEIGHYILDHSELLTEINIDVVLLEKEADYAAYTILLNLGQRAAAELIEKRFFEHYNELLGSFPIKSTQFLKIQKYLNEIKNI